MSRRLARWRQLAPEERRLLLGLMLGLPFVAAMLRVLGMMRTRQCLERCSRMSRLRRADQADLSAAQRMARLADIAGRRGAIKATCLRQSLLVYWLLRRRGLDPELKIGVRKQGDALDAHAWVELQGVALGQSDRTHQAFAIPRPNAA